MDPIKLLVIGDTKPPIREKNDAGIDIFIPNLTEEYVEKLVKANPGQPVHYPAGVLDPSFSGEIMVHIFNFSSSMKFLSFGQKIAQMIPYVYNAEDHINNYIETIEKFKEYKNLTTEEKFYEGFESHRPDNGQAGFGSSGS